MNFTINLTLSLTFPHLLLLLASTLLTVHLVVAHKCLEDKCQCLWQKNKLSADCSLQKLSSLPQDTYSPEVQAINLTQNSFSELKRNIFLNSNLVNLQKIYLQLVGLDRVDENAFNKVKNLIELDLSHNILKHIPSKSFWPINKLRILDLSMNMIPSVPDQSFYNLSNLKTLSLERNQITFIADNAFIGLVSLETLKLSQNRIWNLRSQTLVPLTKVHSLTLSGNPWKCDCNMRSVRKYLLANNRISIPDKPQCVGNQSPDWTQLGLDSFLCSPVILTNYSSDNLNVIDGSTLRLECALVLAEEEDVQPISVEWSWKNIPISNNSKGCGEDCLIRNKSQQYFLITERIQINRKVKNQKLKISRLELSSVQAFNSGQYTCVAQNRAGKDRQEFTVVVSAQDPKRKVTAAEIRTASSESLDVNDSSNDNLNEGETDKVVIGLILGILFGIFLVLILFGISIILLCRRRQQKQQNNRNNCVSEGTEMEKLTPDSNSTLKVNPIQKPPRLGLGLGLDKRNLDKEIPQVWLIKHNGANNIDHNMSCDYSTQLLYNDNYDPHNMSDPMTEPDLIHPSAYVRERHIQVTDLDEMSAHSDGTEV